MKNTSPCRSNLARRRAAEEKPRTLSPTPLVIGRAEDWHHLDQAQIAPSHLLAGLLHLLRQPAPPIRFRFEESDSPQGALATTASGADVDHSTLRVHPIAHSCTCLLRRRPIRRRKYSIGGEFVGHRPVDRFDAPPREGVVDPSRGG